MPAVPPCCLECLYASVFAEMLLNPIVVNGELIRLQERLQQAETMMERIVSKKQSSRR